MRNIQILPVLATFISVRFEVSAGVTICTTAVRLSGHVRDGISTLSTCFLFVKQKCKQLEGIISQLGLKPMLLQDMTWDM
jgi:hypothetical protein